jgi:hypothetical protein
MNIVIGLNSIYASVDDEETLKPQIKFVNSFRAKWHDLARYQKPQRHQQVSECKNEKILFYRENTKMEIISELFKFICIFSSSNKRWHIEKLECMKNLKWISLHATGLVLTRIKNSSWILEFFGLSIKCLFNVHANLNFFSHSPVHYFTVVKVKL